ncbi:hypothetical protein GCM10009744_47160 [Kribbella alba]|uniref:Uncharacterized protein n=1 Tax=Kribbella alba TaxID=190197 RepID=A0ABN2FL19_9ACTN
MEPHAEYAAQRKGRNLRGPDGIALVTAGVRHQDRVLAIDHVERRTFTAVALDLVALLNQRVGDRESLQLTSTLGQGDTCMSAADRLQGELKHSLHGFFNAGFFMQLDSELCEDIRDIRAVIVHRPTLRRDSSFTSE